MTGWIEADWPAPTEIVAGSTTRIGGVSTGAHGSLNLGAHVGDDPVAVRENRRRFVEMCALGEEPDWLTQVHGTGVHVAGEGKAGEADAVISRGEAVAVLTADCLPLLLCATSGEEFAAIHGGWRGLAAGIIDATVSRMQTSPGELLAWFGPAISQPAFEVGAEVRDAFLERDGGAGVCFETNDRSRLQADLYGLARRQLELAGVSAVYGGRWCTYNDAERFFSYRRDGQCGRMATFVGLRKGTLPGNSSG
jgi:YfiH family protein